MDVKGLIQALRSEGHSDFEISRFLLSRAETRPVVEKLRSEGYDDKEIFHGFGLKADDPDRASFSGAQNAGNAYLLGGGIPLMAATQAVKEGIPAGNAPRMPALDVVSGGTTEERKAAMADSDALMTISGGGGPKSITGYRKPGGEVTQEPNIGSVPLYGRGPLESVESGTVPIARSAFGGKNSTYSQAKEQYENAKGRYDEEYPLESLGTDLGGSLAPYSPLNTVSRGVAAGTRALPIIGRALSGGAGYDAAGQALPGAGAFGARLASQGAAGGVQGAVTGAATTGLTDRDTETDTGMGAAVGTGVGATVGTGMNAVTNWMRGGPVTRPVAELAQRAINHFGIDLRGAQVGGGNLARSMDTGLAKIPLSGQYARNERQMEQYTSALARTMGEDADNLGTEVMDRAATRIARGLDSVAARTPRIAEDANWTRGLNGIRTRAQQELTPEQFAPLDRMIQNIETEFLGGGGAITGEQFQAMTRTGAPLSRNMKATDPNIKFFSRQIRGELGDLLERSNPQAAGELQRLNGQWKNMITLEDVAETLGADGVMQPHNLGKLLTQVRKFNPDFAYGTGGDLADLARIGNTFLRDVSEATREGAKWVKLVAAGDVLGSGLLGGGMGWLKDDPATGAKYAAIGMAPLVAGRYAGRRLANPAYADRIISEGLGLRPQTLGARRAIPLATEIEQRESDAR